MGFRIGATTRNTLADAFDADVNAGASASTIQIRTGTQPATPETTASGTLLATFTLPDPAFGVSASGVITLNTVAATTGVADGTAGYFRIINGNSVAVADGVVGTSGQQLNLTTTTISTGVSVEITSGTVTMPMGT